MNSDELEQDTLAHLVGYAVIALVLGFANWSLSIGTIVAVGFAMGVILLLARRTMNWHYHRVRREAARGRAATDGGDPDSAGGGEP